VEVECSSVLLSQPFRFYSWPLRLQSQSFDSLCKPQPPLTLR
jgi:hypothetical protein